MSRDSDNHNSYDWRFGERKERERTQVRFKGRIALPALLQEAQGCRTCASRQPGCRRLVSPSAAAGAVAATGGGEGEGEEVGGGKSKRQEQEARGETEYLFKHTISFFRTQAAYFFHAKGCQDQPISCATLVSYYIISCVCGDARAYVRVLRQRERARERERE